MRWTFVEKQVIVTVAIMNLQFVKNYLCCYWFCWRWWWRRRWTSVGGNDDKVGLDRAGPPCGVVVSFYKPPSLSLPRRNENKSERRKTKAKVSQGGIERRGQSRMENIKMAKVVEEEQLAEQNSMEQGLSASFLQLPDVCSAVCFFRGRSRTQKWVPPTS